MQPPADVVILGSGLAALGVARGLVRRGKRVLICRPSQPLQGEATPASAGILDPFFDTEKSRAFFRLKSQAVRRFPALIRSLEQSTGRNAGYARTGMLFAALNSLEKKQLYGRYLRHKKLSFPLQWAEGSSLLKRWPELSREVQAVLFYPQIARVLPKKLQAVLLYEVQRDGAKIICLKQPVQLIYEGARVCGVKSGSRRIVAEHVINAAGSWAGNLSGCPVTYPMEPIRGQVLVVRGKMRLSAVVHTLGSTYIVPWERGSYLLGSTIERAGYQAKVNRAALVKIWRDTGRILPPVLKMKETRSWAGLRPQSQDGLPLIGKTVIPGYWMAAGYYRSGIVIGLHAGDLLGEWVASGRMPKELAFASPLRLTKAGKE